MGRAKMGSQLKKTSLFLAALLAFVLTVPSMASAAGPTILNASVSWMDGKTVTASFNQAITGPQPNKGDFTVTGSVQGSIAISSVVSTGTTIRVVTTAVILGGQTSTLTYSPTTNVPTNTAGESLAGFTVTLSNPGATYIPEFWGFFFNSASPSQIRTTYNDSLTCNLTPANFLVTVNGSARTVTSVTHNCNTSGGFVYINLASPILTNDLVRGSYLPSPGSIQTVFGTPAAAVSNSQVRGVPDTLRPVLTLPQTSSFQAGEGASISLLANEDVTWGITTDRTLSFQLSGNNGSTSAQLLVSSILPVGTYSLGLTAEDIAGNVATATITVVINSGGTSNPTPSPSPSTSPSQSPTPVPTVSPPVAVKPITYTSCAALNKKYLGGIALNFGVRNKGAGMNYIARVDASIYSANFKLDRDRDGIACER